MGDSASSQQCTSSVLIAIHESDSKLVYRQPYSLSRCRLSDFIYSDILMNHFVDVAMKTLCTPTINGLKTRAETFQLV